MERVRPPGVSQHEETLAVGDTVTEGRLGALERALGRVRKVAEVVESRDFQQALEHLAELEWLEQARSTLLADAEAVEKTAERLKWDQAHAGRRVPRELRLELERVATRAAQVAALWDWKERESPSLASLIALLHAIKPPSMSGAASVVLKRTTLSGRVQRSSVAGSILLLFGVGSAALMAVPSGWTIGALMAAGLGLAYVARKTSDASFGTPVGYLEITETEVVQWFIGRPPIRALHESLRGSVVLKRVVEGGDPTVAFSERTVSTGDDEVHRLLVSLIPDAKAMY